MNKMQKSKLKILKIFLITLILNFLPTAPVSAQSLSLSISPPLAELIIMPGRSATIAYELTNNSQTDLSITPYIFPFEPADELGTIAIKNNESRIKGYFSFETGEKFEQPFSIKIGEARQLLLKISIPANAIEKDYYQTLIFATQNLALTGDNQTGNLTQIGSNLLLTISQSGQPPVSAVIEEFSTPKLIDSFSSAKLTLRINNNGNTLFKPFGNIKIQGPLNQEKEFKILEQNILARSIRRLTIDSYKPVLPIGVFKATVEFQPNETPPPINQSITFIYLPYKMLTAILSIFVILFLTKILLKRHQYSLKS